MEKRRSTVSFINMGCFKNSVDTEVIGGMLKKRGMEVVSSYESSDWLIINTCGFIRDSKEESIEEIFDAFEKKERNEVKHIVVMGCLVQRYYDDIKKSFKNADILWGVNDTEELADLIAKGGEGSYKDSELFLYNDTNERIITTPPSTAFIKISEGCNMKCAFCSIPSIRGPFRSRSFESVIREAEKYKESGFSEINLISQNSTYFGLDRGKTRELPKLISKLSKLGLKWIRILYLMPEDVNDELIESMNLPGVLPYFDLPFQHVSKKILKSMNRGNGIYENRKLIDKIRKRNNKSIIRSSFIVGFPGETEEDFEELKKFSIENRIERLGVFGYSDEENTPAFKLKPKINPELINERKEELLDISDRNINLYNQEIVGETLDFLPLGPWDNNTTIGRIYSQAPETDGLTRVSDPFQGDYSVFKVKITGSDHELVQAEKI